MGPGFMTGAHLSRPPVHRITWVQITVLVIVFVIARSSSAVVAQSMLAGGLVAIIPQAWFALRLFGLRDKRSVQVMARSGYAAEVAKFMLSALGFAAVFVLLRPIDGLAVFAGYLLMLGIQIGGSVLLLRRIEKS